MLENQQQPKIIEEAHEIQPEKIQPKAVESQFKENYLEVMNFKGKSYSREYLLDRLANKQITIQESSSINQLDIISVNTSRNYEVIELVVKLGPYQLKINIINNQGPSPIHSLGWISEGSYGKVYKYTSKCGKGKAVKCIEIKNDLKFQEEIFKMIHQYALLKVASALEVAPQIDDHSFDIFVYRNFKVPLRVDKEKKSTCRACIEFQMEYCQASKAISQQEKLSLFRSLYSLHSLGITHNDIKTQNLLFSKALNKWIFLDYGLSSYNKEKIGESKLVSYRGTFRFCGPEMVKLYPNGTGLVDLYWNDTVGLQKSLVSMLRERKQQVKVKVFQGTANLQSHFLMLQLKYHIYFYNFAQIQKKCQQISWQTKQKRWLFYFLFELEQIPDQLKNFLGKLIDWEALSTIQHVNPSQIFGIVTSPLSFRNEKIAKIEAIKQRQDIFAQIARIFLQELNVCSSAKYLKGSIQKKERSRLQKLLANQKEAKVLVKQNEQSYIVLLFQFVDFIKCKFGGISLSKKSLFCRVFQACLSQDSEKNGNEDQKELINEEIKEFKLQAIHFFIKFLIDRFTVQPTGFLLDLFPRIYLNYVMLGLANTQVLQSVYQTILNSKQQLQKICQLFYIVYKNKFWYENVIYLKQEIDFFKIRKTQMQALTQICRKINFIHSLKDHSCTSQQFCDQIQQTMAEGVGNFHKKKVKQANNINHRLSKYVSILQVFQQNLAKMNQINKQKLPSTLSNTFQMRLQNNKQADAVVDKIKFSSWEIPIDLPEFYTQELFGINSESFCQSALHLQEIFNFKQITQLWFITILKNLVIFNERSDKNKMAEYFNSIKTIYEINQFKNSKSIYYLMAFNKMRRFFLKLTVKNMVYNEIFQSIIGELQNCMKIVGNFFTQAEIVQYLVVLNQERAYSIWMYLKAIKDQEQRVQKILSLFIQRLASVPCRIKAKLKQLSYMAFSHLYLGKPVVEYSAQQRQQLDDFVLSQNSSKQSFFIKYKYIEQMTLEISKKLEAENKVVRQVERYFVQLNKVMTQYEDQEYFLTQKIRFHIFCLYCIYLLQNKYYDELIKLLHKLCSRIFNYISMQTFFLLHRLKITLFNYYVSDINMLIIEWPSFRDFFIRQVQKRSNISLEILNIFVIYMQLIYQTLKPINFTVVKANKFTFQKLMMQNYKALRLFDLMNLHTKWNEIQYHFRCWHIIINDKEIQKPICCLKPRFLRNLRKKHKKVIQLILARRNVQNVLNTQLSLFAVKNEIHIFSKFSKNKLAQMRATFLQKFKEKMNQYYHKQISVNKIRVFYNH